MKAGAYYFCSESCFNAYCDEYDIPRSNQEVVDRLVASGQKEADEYFRKHFQHQREWEEEQRRQKEKEEQERKEREEKARQEKLGKCSWCGRQNEQIFANQLLFPGSKFCSKKCLFDCRSAENPAEPAADTPRITMQPSGNIYTSIKDAVDDAPDGETLLFSNGVFEVNETIEVDKTLTFKATNSDMNSGLSERTVFKMHDINWLQPSGDKATIDGIVFEGMDKEKSRGFWALCDELVIKNCVFMTLHHAIEFIGNNIKIENCLFINCTWAFRQNHSFFDDSDYLKDCTFDSVKYIFEEKSCDCLENCTIKNSLLSPHYDVPSNNAQSYNERSKKTYGCLQTAIDEAVSGDTIVLAPGTQYEGFCLEGKSDITIKASVINTQAPDPQKSVVSVDVLVYISGCKNVKFEGIIFKNLTDYNFKVRDSEDITFNSCELYGTENEVYMPVNGEKTDSLSFGIDIGGGYYKILEKSENEKSVIFSTSADNQSAITLSVYAAFSNATKNLDVCAPLGSYDFSGIKPAPKGHPQIEVSFNVVDSFWLKMTVSVDGSGLRPKCASSAQSDNFTTARKKFLSQLQNIEITDWGDEEFEDFMSGPLAEQYAGQIPDYHLVNNCFAYISVGDEYIAADNTLARFFFIPTKSNAEFAGRVGGAMGEYAELGRIGTPLSEKLEANLFFDEIEVFTASSSFPGGVIFLRHEYDTGREVDLEYSDEIKKWLKAKKSLCTLKFSFPKIDETSWWTLNAKFVNNHLIKIWADWIDTEPFIIEGINLKKGGAKSSAGTCPGCGAAIKPGKTFCTKCGTGICPNCGGMIKTGKKFCTKCGTRL